MEQPATKSQEVFEKLFSDPDWGALYEIEGVQDTAFENKDAFASYMENTFEDSKLTYMETSTGLSEDKKYIVRLGKEKIAAFTLVEHNHSDSKTEIPDWLLGTIELYFAREESYRIQKLDGHTVYVNNVPLDDSSTIRISTTYAEKYLPEGITGVRICTQEISGLVAIPSVRIVDDSGNEMAVIYDAASRTFIEQTKGSTINDTKDKIAVTSDILYIFVTVPSNTRLIAWLYRNDNYIGFRTIEYSDVNNKVFKTNVIGATHIIIGFDNPSVDFNNVCISFDIIDGFETYKTETTIKDSVASNYEKHYLCGKTIVNFGDSIFGNKRPPEDVSTEIARLTGATVINGGFGGCFMSKHGMPNYEPFSMFRLADAIETGDWSAQEEYASKSGIPFYFVETVKRLKEIDWLNVDIITIAYGTNDFTNPKPIDSTDNPKDTDTFGGALRYSIERILGAYPNVQIFICGQTYRFWLDSSLNFVEDSDTKTNLNGNTLPQFVEKTKDIAKEYHLPFIDNYYDLGINKFNRTNWFPLNDGTHHNIDGGRLIAKHMVNEMF